MDTPIVIIIFAYIASFSFLGVQSVVGDPIGVQMKVFDDQTGGFTGTDLRNQINTNSDTFAGCYDVNENLIGGFGNQTYTTEAECNTASAITTNPDIPYEWVTGTNDSFSSLSYQTAQMQLTMANQNNVTVDPIATAAESVYFIFQVMTGTYAFNILSYMGIPAIFVAGISMIYIILIAIWTIMLLRGNNIS